MPRYSGKESVRVAGAVPAGDPAFWPQEDFPRGYSDGDLIAYNEVTGLWERISEADFVANSGGIVSSPRPGEYRVANIRLGSDKKILITYLDEPAI